MREQILEAFMAVGMDILKAVPFWVYLVLIFMFYLKIKFHSVSHFTNIMIASWKLRKLKTIEKPQAQFGFLRSVNAYVFEEMILTALKDLGFKIKRNRAYSGDGGIDGQAVINGKRVYIQAKRYRNHISQQHVKDFARVCHANKRHGLFVHTGKTGAGSWKTASMSQNVDIVSGERMLALLLGKSFNSRWV